jgi:BMFP domain-containing protein YqiC
MTERPKFFDDLAGVAGGALSAFSGLRDETAALIKARVDEAIRKLDLVRREEFEVANEIATKASLEVERLSARVAALESANAAREQQEIEAETKSDDHDARTPD